MATETWDELIKNENQLNDLSKEELIGCVKTLLDYAKHSDDVMAKKDEYIEKLNVCCNDFKSLYDKAKPYLFAYYERIHLPFGFYIARAKKESKND